MARRSQYYGDEDEYGDDAGAGVAALWRGRRGDRRQDAPRGRGPAATAGPRHPATAFLNDFVPHAGKIFDVREDNRLTRRVRRVVEAHSAQGCLRLT